MEARRPVCAPVLWAGCFLAAFTPLPVGVLGEVFRMLADILTSCRMLPELFPSSWVPPLRQNGSWTRFHARNTVLLLVWLQLCAT